MKQFETQIRDFSQQFTEQIKCLDAKVTVDINILGNMFDLYKRRAAIEQEYSDNLLKLTTIISQRNNIDNQKKLKWKNYSPATVLNSLLASTQYTAKAHRNMADIYGKQLTQRIVDMQDDCIRLNKKASDILQKHHAEIIRSLNQLLTKQKLYLKTFNESDESRKRVDRAMEQLDREVVRCQDKKKELDKNQRIKRFKEDYIEKSIQFRSKQADSTIARNKYIIHLESLKETIDYFYSHELKNIVECAEYGFHNNLTRLSMNHTSCEDALITVHESINKLFTDTIDKIDANNDTQVFIDAHKSILSLKETLHFMPAKDDNINKIINSQESVQNCLQNMYVRFNTDMSTISKKVNDDKIIIDSLSRKLNDLINQNDYDVVDYICHQSQDSVTSSKERSSSLPRNRVYDSLYTSLQKVIKENKMKTEANYFQAMEIYLNDEINKVNMATKLKNVECALNNKNNDMENQISYKDIQNTTAVIVGIKSKLFGGDLTKYSRETNEIVPVVVQSCIRLINLYGMRNIGVFRVPGSQIDVQNYKSQFEQGTNPLKTLKGTSNDVNLAASILKLYFRELDPPIFDVIMFKKIVDNYNFVKRNEESVVTFLKELVLSLSPPGYATLNYILSFISHLSEFATDNCMDILNLAIIFGPCLMPIPEDKSNQLFQYQSIVTHVVQCLITHHKTIFVQQVNGPVYERDQQNLLGPKESVIDSHCSSATENVKFFENISTNSLEDLKNLKRNETTRFIRTTGIDSYINTRRKSESSPVRESSNLEILKQKDLDMSSPESQRLNHKDIESVKRSFASTDSDNDMSPDDNRSLSQSLENPLDSSELGDCKSCDSLENIVDDDEDDNMLIKSVIEVNIGKNSPMFNRLVTDKNTEQQPSQQSQQHQNSPTTVRIRESRSSITIYPDTITTTAPIATMTTATSTETDVLDEDLEQTIRGLKHIEELNVIKHRNTVHIDKSLLKSKFICPLNSNSSSPLVSRRNNAAVLLNSSDFKLKKPGTIAALTSSFEMNSSPSMKKFDKPSFDQTNSLNRNRNNSPVDYSVSTNLPPPTFPKPKLLKK